MLVALLLSLYAQAEIIQLNPHTNSDFADPSAPIVEGDTIRIFMTAGETLSWKLPAGSSDIAEVLRTESPQHERLKICHADGSPLDEASGEDAWDPTIRNGVLYAGVMTPMKGESAIWPEDHWSRRTYPFLWRGECWVMAEEPLWGERPTVETWIGHNYGHEFFTNDQGNTYVFYERVTDDRYGQPWHTEIFARRMLDYVRASDEEIAIYGEDWPATRRASGGHLLEGPRPFRAFGKYFISFSGGDYQSDDYGIHLLYSDKIEGPYEPYLNEEGTDLKNFSQDVERSRNFRWGAGRAVFFESGDRWWTIFHGIDPEADKAEMRSIYLAPVSMVPREDGPPEIRIN